MKKRYLFMAIFLLIILFSGGLRFYPYLSNDWAFEIGFDTGYYENIFTKYQMADNWDKLPAYPDMPYVQAHQLEPGLYVTFVPIMVFSGTNIHDYFRYFLPFIFGVFICFGTFLVLWKYSRCDIPFSLFGMALTGISFVQIDAVNASYYRQILALFIFLVILWRFDEAFLGKKRDFLFIVLMGASLFALHRAVFMFFIAMLAMIILLHLMRRDIEKAKTATLIILCIFALSLPFWLPNIQYQIHTIEDIYLNTISGINTQFQNGYNQQGGGVPDTFSRNNVLGSYIRLYPLLFLFAIIGITTSAKIQDRWPVIIGFVLLLCSLIFWFAFGNRMLQMFDLLIIIIAIVGLKNFLTYAFKRITRKGLLLIILSFIISFLFILPAIYVFEYQEEREPLIVLNIEGVEWMEDNIPKNNSIIFTTDRLAVSFLQRGFDVANLDWTLSRNYSHPMTISEEFIIESPSNLTYLADFYTKYQHYLGFNIYVIWGENDVLHPLPYINKMIPIDAYSDSEWYEIAYSGYNEIQIIYRLDPSSNFFH